MLEQWEKKYLPKKKQRRLRRDRWRALPTDEKLSYIFSRAPEIIAGFTVLAGCGAFCWVIDRLTDSGFLMYVIGYLLMGGGSMYYLATSLPKYKADELQADLHEYEIYCKKLEAAIEEAVDRHDFYSLRPVCDEKFFDKAMDRYYAERYGDPPPM